MSTTSEEQKKVENKPEVKEPGLYGTFAALPTIEIENGILFDFVHGFRIYIPPKSKPVKVVVTDADTHDEIYTNVVNPGYMITGTKKYYIRYKLVFSDAETGDLIREYTYNAASQPVMIQFPRTAGLGDMIAWFSAAVQFKQKHKCNLIVAMPAKFASIFKKTYSDVLFVNYEDTIKYKLFAMYLIGIFYEKQKDPDFKCTDYSPVDFHYMSLCKIAANILGLNDYKEIPPDVDLSAPRRIREKYVVIAAQASAQCKYWNNPDGWHDVIKFLHERGYRVICIDREKVYGSAKNCVYNHIPNGAEDYTGELPLQERIDILKDADFFIGFSSGLAWVAWCCHIPVVLISGFTNPISEFHTPYRVINYHVCNSCWNDIRYQFDVRNYMWCPRHGDDDRRFECTAKISSDHVISMIRQIPQFHNSMK